MNITMSSHTAEGEMAQLTARNAAKAGHSILQADTPRCPYAMQHELTDHIQRDTNDHKEIVAMIHRLEQTITAMNEHAPQKGSEAHK